MPHVVIIGAGPTGLDLANKLKQKGIKDIIVYDPRAGDYVRPGLLDVDIFQRAEAGLSLPLNFNKQTSHIRDIEKKLYNQAILQHILIEKKQFVRLSEEEKGIYVAYQNEQHELVEEFVPCDYVFDCSGSKRVLAHNINSKHERNKLSKPFVTSPISQDVIIKKHLIAYLKIDNDLALKVQNPIPSETTIFSGKTPLERAQALEKLRPFGWTEFTIPACYHTHFKENKNCFYIECPNNLPEEQKQAWLNIVLSIVTDQTTIQYEHMKSKKGRSKPNFTLFTVDPQQLNCFTYHEQGLPHVVILGDGQMEPNFVLGHGIAGAFERNDILIKSMVVSHEEITSYDAQEYNRSEKIIYYNAKEYNKSVKDAIKMHQHAIIDYYKIRKIDFRAGANGVKPYYTDAITQTTDPVEKALLTERLEEITARTAYYSALYTIAENSVQLNQNNSADVLEALTDAKQVIEQALSKLTQFEQREATQISQRLIINFKNIGYQALQQAKYGLAIKAYKEALGLHAINGIKNNEERLSTYASLIVCYRKTGQLENVLAAFQEAAPFLEQASDAIKKKILFHVIKIIAKNLNVPMSDNQRLKSLASAASILDTYHDVINTHLAGSLKLELNKIDDAIAEVHNSSMPAKKVENCPNF
ncbi:4-hydroxybenzoate 3-monooxygenase [Legionella beliardensis]|uniref:4-hydroxybenzoate 3-monooxygenase n=1 Tax=Legionella beliardensis TaxID=91822 RepID=A0A378I283_9GAMM|nr:hypothetical protein [Legionella beliardensis]STX28840.1 4-hydroxybenzoate 3-monooxygenase [Legionella beliardensis]